MRTLPNNCRAGKFSVYPNNWKTAAADPTLSWRIIYWFYDDNLKQRKQVPIKGMNHLESLKEKQEVTKAAIKNELQELENGYNPITKSYFNNPESEIDEHTPLLEALEFALTNAVLVHNTRIDVTNTLKYITMSIKDLHYERMPIGQIEPRDIKRILDGCAKIKTYIDKKGKVKKKVWGPYQFNRYKSYLSLLFRVLTRNFIISFNPVKVIEKVPQLKKIRETTTREQRDIIKKYTKTHLYTFYRFLQIFFQSASRITEVLAVKKEDVRLEDQRFKITVRKGQKLEEEWRTITDLALPFWIEVYKEAAPSQYLFWKKLKPGFGEKPIRAEQIDRRWRRHAKKKFGITADFYSLKHTFLEELAKKEGIEKAQKAAGHSTPVVTMIYAHGEDERIHERNKKRYVDF